MITMNESNPASTKKVRKPISLNWRDLNLRTKLIVVFIVVALAPLSIITLLNNNNTRTALTNDANTALLAAASTTATQLDAFITQGLTFVGTEAQLPDFIAFLSLPASQRAENADEVTVILSVLTQQDPTHISSISLLDKQGVALLDTFPADVGTNKADRDYFKKVIETGQPYASEVEFSRTTGDASIYFSAPVRDAAGKIIGVFRIRYNASILQEYIAANVGLVGANSYPVLLNANHVRLAEGNDPALIFKSIIPLDAATVSDLQAKLQLPPGSPQELSTDLPGFEAGVESAHTQTFFAAELEAETGDTNTSNAVLEQAAVAPMKTQSWEVVFAQPQDVFLAPINTQVRNNIVLTLVIAVVVAFLGFFMSQTLAGPIVRLTQVAETVSGGDINAQAKVESKDETGKLAVAFNTMTARLREFIATLEQRVADRTQALATSTEVSRRLSTILDRKQLVTEVVNQVNTSFGYYHTQIYFYDETKDNLVMAGGTGEAGALLLAQFHKVAKGRGLVGRAAESNEPVLVPDTKQNPDWLPNPLLRDTRSEVAIPISIGEDVLGVLDVQHNITDGLQQQDVDALQSITNQVAVALQNIRQYENTRKIAADMGVVAKVGIATSTITEAGRLLQEVVDLSKKSFDLYHVHIYLLDEEGDTLELAAGAGEVGKQMVSEKRSIQLDSEKSLVARAARTREGVVVNDVTIDPNFLPNPLLPDTRSEMAVPMIAAGKVIGVLDVQDEVVNRFTDVDVDIQTTLASQVAVALQNARSFSQSQRQAVRETAVNQITQKIQNATSIEAALQIAARELGHALGMKSTRVTLDPEAMAGENKGN
jgi:GAF domain-containing protein/HAMP domain-containing protein